VLWLGKRFQFERSTWLRSLLVHLPTSLLLSTVQLLIAEVVLQSFLEEPLDLYASFTSIRFSFVFNFHINVLTYWAILGVGYARENYRKYRDRELRAAQLEAQLSQAQLQALKMQLQPHFLFNTLNAISSLIHEDVHAADQVLARLGDLLRYSLRNLGVQEVTLREELDFLQRYLEIEKIRFGTRLKVKMAVEPETLDLKVPNLILQPLVENAIQYAVTPRTRGGRIDISAHRENGSLRLVVRDDGPGLPNGKGAMPEEGIGLRNTRARLQQLYGDEHQFMIFNKAPSGVEVCLVIPVRPS
jgi:sensor histidine kinase YesM